MKGLFAPEGSLGRIETALLRGIEKFAECLPGDNSLPRKALMKVAARDMMIYGRRLRLLPKYFGLASSELGEWERYYKSPAINGGVVMDVGAGCGETAVFFLHWGASKVIAIESDHYAFEMLERNMRQFGSSVETFEHKFSLDDLKRERDLVKIDIEGDEVILLDYCGKLGACIIESHERIHNGITSKLIEKFQLKALARFTNGTAIVSSN